MEAPVDVGVSPMASQKPQGSLGQQSGACGLGLCYLPKDQTTVPQADCPRQVTTPLPLRLYC